MHYTDHFSSYIRTIVILRAAIVAVGISLPVLASVLAFIVYGIHHPLNPAIIFTSLTLFNMLRMPLMLFRELSLPCTVWTVLIFDPFSRFLEYRCRRL